MLDVPHSLSVAKNIPLKKKACYRNALLALLCQEELQHGWYVEGFAIPTIGNLRLPMEHGWIELKDGRIIDPSFADLGHTDVAYFPALKLQWKRARRLIFEHVSLPYMLSHKTIHHRAAYLKALLDAYKAAFGTEYSILLEKAKPK